MHPGLHLQLRHAGEFATSQPYPCVPSSHRVKFHFNYSETASLKITLTQGPLEESEQGQLFVPHQETEHVGVSCSYMTDCIPFNILLDKSSSSFQYYLKILNHRTLIKHIQKPNLNSGACHVFVSCCPFCPN